MSAKMIRATVMSRAAFERLLDYSSTIPTCLPVGLRWRRREEWIDSEPRGDGMAAVRRHAWWLGRVVAHEEPERDQWDRPLYKGTRSPMGGPGDRSVLAVIRWTRIGILEGGRVVEP